MRKLFGRRSKKGGLFIVLGLVGVAILGSGAYAALGGAVRPAASGDVELQRGLVGHWDFDGNTKDATPNADNATTSTGTFTADRKAKASSAYTLDGISQYVSMPDGNHLDTGSVTVSMWATVNSVLECDANNNWHSLISKGSTGSTVTGWDVVLEQNNNITWDVGLAGVSSRLGASVGLTQGVTKLVTFTYDATTGDQKVYTNGVQTATKSNTPTAIGVNATALNIGKGTNAVACPNGNGYAPVTYDDVRVYDRALSLAEAKALYEQYDGGLQAASGESGLIGHWKFDGNTKDSSPYGGDATNTGAATLTTDRKGASSRAYSFNGTSNYMTVSDNDIYSPTTITVSAWVYWAGGDQRDIVSKNGNSEYRYRINTNGSVTVFDRGATNPLNTAASVLSTNQWYLLSFTGDGSGLKIYINGVLSTSNATAYGAPNTAGTLIFGSFNGASEFFNGSIDDIRIYNRVLSAPELLAQYQAYDSQINLNAAPTNTAAAGNINQGIVGSWPFSGNARDATPYSGNGTLVNAPVLAADRFGRSGSAYAFTAASSQEITMADSPALSPTTAMSVAAWFKGTVQNTSYATGGSVAGILTKDIGGTAANPIYGFQVTNGTLAFSTTSSTNVNIQSVVSGLLDNTWYFAVGTYDGTNMRLYLNGTLQDTDAQVTLDDSTGLLRIGRQKTGFVRYFEGTIDDVRVYNRALSAGEISTLYAQ